MPTITRTRGQAAPAPTDGDTFADAPIPAQTRRTRSVVELVLVLAIGLAVAVWMSVRSLFGIGVPLLLIGSIAAVLPALVAAMLAARGGGDTNNDVGLRQRRGWRLVGVGCALAMGSTLILVTGVAGVPLTPAVRDITAATMHVLAIALFVAGLLHWITRFSLPASIGLTLDLVTVGMLGYLLMGASGFATIGSGVDGAVEAMVFASYHGLPVVVLLAAVTVLSQIGRTELGGAVVIASFGIAALAGSDLYVGWLAGAHPGGLGPAMVNAVGLGDLAVAGDMGWNIGFLLIAAGAGRYRAKGPIDDANAVPLLERSTTWETVWALIPFTMLASAIVAWNGSQDQASLTRAGFLGLVGLLLVRCGMVAVHNLRLAHAATIDPLTGAFNHRHFQERIAVLADEAITARQPLSLVMMDIDDFELLNDTCGHAEGDRYLREAAWVMRQNIASGHQLFRSGGDEFALALPAMSAVEAMALATEIAQAVSNVRGAGGIEPSLTMGIATLPSHTFDAHELVHLAEGTRYWGKLSGKRRLTVYDPEVVKVLTTEQRVRVIEQTAQLRAVLALARALDTRDAYTARHSQNVARYAVAIAYELGWEAEQQELLRIAGLLHDVGKIGVRDATLRKSERLTQGEWAEMRKHPVLSTRMIAGVAPEAILPWVMAHHERVDGRGYPRGMSGDAIPLGARVLAVADSFDAMTSSRSYRPGMPVSTAIREIAACVDEQFDPEVVHAFLRAVKSSAITVEKFAPQVVAPSPASIAAQPEGVAGAIALVDPEFTPVDDADAETLVGLAVDEELAELVELADVRDAPSPDGGVDDEGDVVDDQAAA